MLLFPPWRFAVTLPLGNRHIQRYGGYAFVFTPPDGPNQYWTASIDYGRLALPVTAVGLVTLAMLGACGIFRKDDKSVGNLGQQLCKNRATTSERQRDQSSSVAEQAAPAVEAKEGQQQQKDKSQVRYPSGHDEGATLRDAGQSTPPERLIRGGILVCRKCGTKNRVADHSRKLRPVCVHCRNPLSESMATMLGRIAFRFKPVWIGACVVVGCVMLAVLANQTPSRAPVISHAPPRIDTPVLPPSRFEPAPQVGGIVPVNSVQSPIDSRPKSNRRLPNGTVIRSGDLDGSGKLKIDNGLSYDAAAKLVDPQTGHCVAYFYVSSGDVYTLLGIPNGNYRLLFGIGEDWDNTKGSFLRLRGISEFSERLLFETRKKYEGGDVYQEYTVLQMTLHSVPDGNARTHTVSSAEFEKY